MSPQSKTIALVPAKASSKRVPDKNLRALNGSSLIERKVATLRQCRLIDEVVVGSDSDTILQLASKLGATPLHRLPYFCDEDVCPANDMILDMATRADGELIVWAHCTNPFIGPDTYDDAITRYHAALQLGHDSLVSVTRVQSHIWTGPATPLNFEPLRYPHQLASQLTPMFFQNGGIFIQSREQMIRYRYFYGKNPHLFEIDEFEALDVNTERDFAIAEQLDRVNLSHA